MAFPTTGVLDNFNRTNESPLSDGGNWTNPLLFGNSQLNTTASTVVLGSSAGANSAYRSNTTYGPNCEAYVTLASKSGTNLIAVYARIANPNSSGATDGYDVSLAISGATDTLRVGRIDNDTRTVIASASQEVSAGDSFGLECNGTTISAYYKASGSGWNASATASTTDATYGSAGNVGLTINNLNHTCDDFGGGTIVGGQTITVNQATETDLAQPIGRLKTRLVAQALETDLAQALTARKIYPLGQPAEADLAQPFAHSKTVTLGQSVETDLAQPILVAGGQVIPVNQVVETDLAQPILWSPKNRLLSQATESDLAQPITVVGGAGVGGRHVTQTFIPVPHRWRRN